MTRPIRMLSSKKLVAALLHLQQDAVDVRDPELEVAHQIRLVHRELTIHFVERREVVAQELGAFAHRRDMPFGQGRADPERIQQLQLHASRRVERLADVALERLESARRPGRRVPLLRAQREPGADRGRSPD
jgi:hypothetical protein